MEYNEFLGQRLGLDRFGRSTHEQNLINQYHSEFSLRSPEASEVASVDRIMNWAKEMEYNHSSMLQQLKMSLSQRDVTVGEQKSGLMTRVFHSIRVFFFGDPNEESKAKEIGKDIDALSREVTSSEQIEGMDFSKAEAYSTWRHQRFQKYADLQRELANLIVQLGQSKFAADKLPRFMVIAGAPAAVVGASAAFAGFLVAQAVYTAGVGVFSTGFGLLTDGGSRDAQVVDAAQRVIAEVNKLKSSSAQ